MELLPPDLLAIVAEFVVGDHGEAYWCAATCKALRVAVRVACGSLGIAKPVSRLRTAFASLARIRAAMRLQDVQRMLCADTSIAGAEHLPCTLDREFTWSPVGRRALIAGTTRDLLDYAWANWKSSFADYTMQATAVGLMCELGRIDLLEELYKYQQEEDPRAWTNTNMERFGYHKFMFRTIRLAVEGFPPAVDLVKRGLIVPAILGASSATIAWLHDKMEAIGEGLNSDGWRTCCADAASYTLFGRQSALSSKPYDALAMVSRPTTGVIGRFATRAPQEHTAALSPVMHSSLATVACIGTGWPASPLLNGAKRTKVWQWLRTQWSGLGGLSGLLRLYHLQAGSLGCTYPISRLHRDCFRVQDAETYRWMRDIGLASETSFAHSAFVCTPDAVTWTILADLRHCIMRYRMLGCARHAFAEDIFQRLMIRHNVHEARLAWPRDRELAIECFVDLMWFTSLETREAREELRAAQRDLLNVSVEATAQALKQFHERGPCDVRRKAIVDTLLPDLLTSVDLANAQLHEVHDYDTVAAESDDESPRAAAYEYISKLRGEYYKRHGGPGSVSGRT